MILELLDSLKSSFQVKFSRGGVFPKGDKPIIRKIFSFFPFSVNIVGPSRKIVMKIIDLIPREHSFKKLYTEQYVLDVDLSFSNERLLYYTFDNIIRTYLKSDFYRIMKKYIKKDCVFIDIGANLGLYSLLAKQLGAYTILFEPEPRHFNFLSRNKTVFDEVYSCALSNFEGKATFNIGNDDNLGGSSLTASSKSWEDSGYDSQLEVQVNRFDNFIFKKPKNIRLIKIDVEGNEYETVCGMEGFLKSGYKPVIWCEVRGPQSDRNPNSYLKVSNYLANFGYKPYIIKKNLQKLFIAKSDEIPQVFDLLFLSF